MYNTICIKHIYTFVHGLLSYLNVTVDDLTRFIHSSIHLHVCVDMMFFSNCIMSCCCLAASQSQNCFDHSSNICPFHKNLTRFLSKNVFVFEDPKYPRWPEVMPGLGKYTSSFFIQILLTKIL